MKNIEKPPYVYEGPLYKAAIAFFPDLPIQARLKEINEQYPYWDKAKYLPVEGIESPELLWAGLKLRRTLHAKKLSFGPYGFDYNITDAMYRALHEFDLHIGGTLGVENLPLQTHKAEYLIGSIMEEAIASSQIEGAATTRKTAKEMLWKNRTPKNHAERMIVNNYETIRHIVEHKDEPISAERLFEIHRLITRNTLENQQDEGRYRDGDEVTVADNIDGEIVYYPPPYQQVTTLMNDLFNFFNTNDSQHFIHPIIKGCIIHFMVGFIHPFVDGNGRTARALFYWYLLKNGYWLTEYLSISRLIVRSKNQYAKSFLEVEADANDLTYFLMYKVKIMQKAYRELQEYIQRKIAEKKQLNPFHKLSSINERQAQLLKWLHEEKDLMLHVKEVEIRFQVSNQTARADLMNLVKQGFLQEISLNRKTKAYIRAEGFEALLHAV